MLIILFLIWIIALAIGIILANVFKAKQSLGIGFMLSILFTLATLLVFPKILLFGKDEPLPPVTKQISPMPSEPNKKYSLNMITAMQKDAEKLKENFQLLLMNFVQQRGFKMLKKFNQNK